MSFELAIRWAFILAWVLVLDLLWMALRRLYLEAKRLGKRLGALIEKPLPVDFAKAESDAARIIAAIDRAPTLVARGALALERLRMQIELLRGLVRGFPGPTKSGPF